MNLIDSLKKRANELHKEIIALWFAFRDPQTPWYAKAFSGLVVAYAFSPIDLIPDFIPVLGYLDDLILIPAGIALAIKMIPAEVMKESRLKAEQQMGESKPTNWLMGIVIILIWLVGLFFLGRWILSLIHKS